MIKLLLSLTLVLFLHAENNVTESNKSSDNNTTISKNLQKLIEKEKKIKKEQKFYQGEDYNLSENKVDKSVLDKVPLIEPEYDFDITDLYNDQ